MQNRTSAEYQQWRQNVRQRDRNSCRRCGFATNLEVHHIKPLVKYPEFATELENGLTLCGNCHSLLKGREETVDLLKFIEASPYSRDKQIVERLMAMMSEQLKALNDRFAELTGRKAEVLIGNDSFIEPGHIQAEMLRLEAEEKFREAERLTREADEAVKKRRSEDEQKRQREIEEKHQRTAEKKHRREAEQKRQRETEKQQRRNAEEKLRTTKQRTSLRDFQEGNSENLSDNRVSVQVKKKKNLGKPKSSHTKDLKQTDRAGTRQRNNTGGKWKHKREADRNRSKVKTVQRRRIDAATLEKLELLAKKGDATAQLSLGIQYERSGKNDGKAVRWYRKAAKQGDAEAQYNLGRMYEHSEGAFKDNREAVKWYRKAAEQGYPAAQNKLGWMYQNGQGVPQNNAEALKWYQKAAEGGYSAAQDNLD